MRMKPANSFWTDEQWEAIISEGSNVLVSAGAGSGKTAVLSERVIDKLKQGVNIDDLIIMTFTNAAAAEMKERIKKKIIKEVDSGNELLVPQVDRVDISKITTFDSFCMDIVKDYGYLIGVSSDIKIADSIVLESEKELILDDMFNSRIEDSDFKDLLSTYTTKSPYSIRMMIKSLYTKFEMIPNVNLFLDEYMNDYCNDEVVALLWSKFENQLIKTKNELVLLMDNMLLKYMDEKLINYLNDVSESLRFVFDSNDYDSLKQAINAFVKFKRFPTAKSIDSVEKALMKEEFEAFKTLYKEMTSKCLYKSTEVAKKEYVSTFEHQQVIISLLKEFHNKLQSFKYENQYFDFIDIEKLAIRILEEKEEVREYFKHKTNEIMIDEYQDTNDLQEYLVSIIENNNVYMVGDLKQSIYGFRNANPSLFLDKYSNYSKNIKGKKIDLSLNFRSREEVLNDINSVFFPIFDERIGGIDYDESQKLSFGNKRYDEFKEEEYGLKFHTYDEEIMKEEGLKKNEYEAKLIASDIIEKLNNGYQIYDKDDGSHRKCRLDDFTILTSTKSSYETYLEIFEEMGLPLAIHKDESFFYSDEIYVIKNILSLIKCSQDMDYAKKHYKHAFYSVMKSFVFRKKDQMIYEELKLNPLPFLWKKNGSLFTEFHEQIRRLGFYSKQYSISELLNQIYVSFNINYELIYTVNPSIVQTKYDFLLDKTMELESMYYTFDEYLTYFENLLNHKLDINFGTSSKLVMDKVNMMTIHKSKGLEFSVVYFPEVYKIFNRSDFKTNFIFNKPFGLIIPAYNEGLKDVFVKDLFKHEYLIDNISEQLRVLYVALTRIKELGLIIMPNKEFKTSFTKNLVSDFIREKYDNFQKMYESMLARSDFIKEPIEVVNSKYQSNFEETAEKVYSPTIVDLKFDTEQVMNTRFSKTILKTFNKDEIEKIKLGNKLHEFLEYTDFHNPSPKTTFESEILAKILATPFMKNVDSLTFQKEYEFYYEDGNEHKHGIIDLLIEKEDELIIVDYKLSNIHQTEYIKQVNGYREYLKTITEKEVTCYLYSILEGQYLLVKDVRE